jgi:hypothetical protein
VVREGAGGGLGGAALKILTPLFSVVTWEVNWYGGGGDFSCDLLVGTGAWGSVGGALDVANVMTEVGLVIEIC